MIYTVMSGSSSLREIASIMLACEGKMSRLSIVNLMFFKTEYRIYFTGKTPTFSKGNPKNCSTG